MEVTGDLGPLLTGKPLTERSSQVTGRLLLTDLGATADQEGAHGLMGVRPQGVGLKEVGRRGVGAIEERQPIGGITENEGSLWALRMRAACVLRYGAAVPFPSIRVLSSLRAGSVSCSPDCIHCLAKDWT